MRTKQRRFLAIFLLLFTAGLLFAQQKTQVTVIAPASPSRVLINGSMIGLATPRYSFRIEPGSYELTVRSPGRPEFRRQIQVGATPLTIQARPGAYQSQPQPPQKQRLSIRGNVEDAEVFLNGSLSGRIPFRAELPPGSYDITIRAAGYEEYSGRVRLEGDKDLRIDLQSLRANINVMIPSDLLNMNTGNPAARIRLYIDGRAINGFSAEVEPGVRRVRLESGGLAFETTVNARSGRSYLLEPEFGFTVR